MDAADYRRREGEWDIDLLKSKDISDQGKMAYALLNHLISENELNEFDEDDKENFDRLKELQFQIEKQIEDAGNDGRPDLEAQLSQIEEELSQYDSYADVYDMEPTGDFYYNHMTEFVVPKLGRMYVVGDDYDIEHATRLNLEEYLDSEGYDHLSESLIESNLDMDEVMDFFKETYSEWVYGSPEDYLDESKRELDNDQKKMFQTYKAQYEALKKRKNVFQEVISKEKNEETVSEIEKIISDLSKRIDELVESMEEILEDPQGEFPEEEIDDHIELMLDNVKDDPWSELKEYGIGSRFINQEGVIDDIISSDGYISISPYDGEVHEEYINGVTFYIIRFD